MSHIARPRRKEGKAMGNENGKKTVEDFIRENPTIVETLRDAARVCEAHSHSFIGGALRRYADQLAAIECNMEVKV